MEMPQNNIPILPQKSTFVNNSVIQPTNISQYNPYGATYRHNNNNASDNNFSYKPITF